MSRSFGNGSCSRSYRLAHVLIGETVPTSPEHALHPAELGWPLGVERLDALAEILGAAQATIAMALQFDRDREGGILGIAQELLGGALGERGKAAQLVDQG